LDTCKTQNQHKTSSELPADPASLQAARHLKLAHARHRRREKNLALRQPTLPFDGEEIHA
jgi:hypothetical protein